MPTVINTQQETDKTVPIDTSGDSMDIEIKDENKENVDQQTIESTEEVKNDDVQENKDHDEEEEYSESVKKRINKLTFKIREAERQKEEALKYANSVKKERDDLKGKVVKVDEGYLDEYKKRVSSEMDKAQSILQSAINSGDAKAQVEAQKAIARLAIEEERAEASLKQRSEKKEVKPDQTSTENQEKQPKPQPDPKAEVWAEKNKWFGTDEAMTYTALSIHKRLLQEEGFDGKTDEYYNELDKRIKKEFPHKFEDKNKGSRPVQAVASANRSTKAGRKVVRLTPSQIAIAKRLGVPLEEYAKHVKEA
tara:strand:- start:627 stop:1550 length:924 start_codon:yes stop_codon:yes gene_type:complete